MGRFDLQEDVSDIDLVIGEATTETFGNRWKGAETISDGTVTARFNVTDTSQDLSLSLQAFDMDYDDEVRVELNGSFLKNLEKTSNNKTGNQEISIRASDLVEGENELEFTVKKPTWTWGVGRFDLQEYAITTDKSLILVVDDFSERVLEYENVTLYDYGYLDTIRYYDNSYDIYTGAYSGYGNIDDYSFIHKATTGGFYEISPGGYYYDYTLDQDVKDSGEFIDSLGNLAYYTDVWSVSRTNQTDETKPLHGDWVVEAICQTLESPSSSEIVCIDVDTLNGSNSHLDNLFDDSLFIFQDEYHVATELESILYSFVEYNDSRFYEHADGNLIPVGMSISIGGAAPSIEELNTFEIFKEMGMVIIQAAPNATSGENALDWGMFYPDVINVGAWNVDSKGDLLISNELTIPTLDILANGYVEKPDWGWNFGTSFATPRVTGEVLNLVNDWVADLNSQGTSVEDLPESDYSPFDYSNLIEQLLAGISTDLEVTLTNSDYEYIVPVLSSTVEDNGLSPVKVDTYGGLDDYSVNTVGFVDSDLVVTSDIV